MKLCVCLGVLFIFFGTPSFSQDTVVTIKPSTARYYLEVEDEMYLLREKDSISNELIYTQATQLDLKYLIIGSYKKDSIEYQKREEALTSHIELIRGELTTSEGEVKKQKFLKWLAIGLGALAALFL